MRRRFLLFGLPLAAMLLTLSFLASVRDDKGTAGSADGPRRIEVSTVERVPDTAAQTFSGTVSAEDRAPVSFTLSGRINEVYVAAGESVSRGELLARLDERPYRNALEQASASLTRVESNLGQARRSLERVRKLGEAATEEELEQRETAVQTLRARRREAQAAVAEAQRRLEEASLTAPFAGEVVTQLAERGEVVQPGSPLFLLSGDGQHLEVELSVPERVLAKLDTGSVQEVVFPLSPDIPAVEARISSTARHAGASGGLFGLTMRLADEAASLGVRPGMRAEASLATRLPGETVAIDPSALVSRPDGTPVVYVVEDGTVREVPVELQRAAEERLLARAPLAPGTMVVVSGQKSLIDGEHVEVVKR